MPPDVRSQPALHDILRLLIIANDQHVHHHYVPILTRSPSVLGHAYLVCTVPPPPAIPPATSYPPFDLVLLELPLPNAPALLQHLLDTYPDTRMIAMCDGHDGCNHRPTLVARGVRFVRRPSLCDPGTALRRAVAELFDTTNTVRPRFEVPAD
jgi:hypothetical protein